MAKPLTCAQAAKYLGVSRRWLEILRKTGGGPEFIKLGRLVFYEPADLDRFKERNKHSSLASIKEAEQRQGD